MRLVSESYKNLPKDDPRGWRQINETLSNEKGNVLIEKANEYEKVCGIRKLDKSIFFITPFISDDVEYLFRGCRNKFVIASQTPDHCQLLYSIETRFRARPLFRLHPIHSGSNRFMDVSPQQVVGVSAALSLPRTC